MSKRFIDTGIFDDEWFMELSKDCKLFWIYCITKCNHAGIIKINEKLCKLQTDIKDLHETIKQLGNRLITLNEHLYFIPKFIEFQYPEFPNSKVRQQQSAVEILLKYNLLDKEKLTVIKELNNSYVNDNGNGNDIVNELVINISFDVFWNLYDKKVGDKNRCEKKWNSFTNDVRQKIIDTLPAFLSAIKDKQFQPFPQTYLNQKRWNDEINLVKKPEWVMP